MGVTIRYFAAAKAAVGRGIETVTTDAADSTIASVLASVASAAADPATASDVLARCSFLHNHRATTDTSTPLADGDTLDVLPPFAGG
jgi:molybdopterin converting factor small subunit